MIASEAVLMRMPRQACPHRVSKQLQAMAGVSHAALLLVHLSAHRAGSNLLLRCDKKVSKAAGFTVKAVRLEGDGLKCHHTG